MYDIDTKNVSKGKKFYFPFLVLGLFFFIFIAWILISGYIKSNSMDSQVMSTRVEVSSHRSDEGTRLYLPTYYYEVNGQEYSCTTNLSSKVNPGTSNKPVYYDSKNPSNCMTESSKSNNNILWLLILLPILFIVISVVNIQKISKRLKLIKELNRTGKLVKNLPYRLENTGMAVNNVKIKRPVVDYTLPSGISITLYGDPRHDKRVSDSDGMVDLVIDENNPDNYFIDFEINRLTGNLPTDYYNSNQNGQIQTEQMNK